MRWITLTNNTNGEWLTRKSVWVPDGTHSRKKIQALEEKKDINLIIINYDLPGKMEIEELINKY